jgi:hypothetical protein
MPSPSPPLGGEGRGEEVARGVDAHGMVARGVDVCGTHLPSPLLPLEEGDK